MTSSDGHDVAVHTVNIGTHRKFHASLVHDLQRSRLVHPAHIAWLWKPARRQSKSMHQISTDDVGETATINHQLAILLPNGALGLKHIIALPRHIHRRTI